MLTLVAIFTAECAPKEIRGALTMVCLPFPLDPATFLTDPAMASLDRLWHHGTSLFPTHLPSPPATCNTPNTHQLGYTADLALLDVKDSHGITGLAWRLMMASASLPAVVACLLVYLGPESPRWFLTRGQHSDAYAAMVRLRNTRVQAARDLFQAHVLLKAEMGAEKGGSKVREMFTIRRNRNAMLASEILMVMQQFSGVNVSFLFLARGSGVIYTLRDWVCGLC